MRVSTSKLERSLAGPEKIFLKCNRPSGEVELCAATAALPAASKLGQLQGTSSLERRQPLKKKNQKVPFI